MREELIALAERVEALSGPDREVDRAIVESVRGKPKPGFQHGRIDHYTASLDAAMSLVPEDLHLWTVKVLWAKGCLEKGTLAIVSRFTAQGEVKRYETEWQAVSATPALALTAAALRALAETDQ